MMATADQNPIKDQALLVPIRLHNDIPLSMLAEVWTLSHAPYCGLKIRAETQVTHFTVSAESSSSSGPTDPDWTIISGIHTNIAPGPPTGGSLWRAFSIFRDS